MLAGALLVLGYLSGSIPVGVLLSRLRGVDPRDVGSGSIGATNVLRAAGPAIGALTLAGDALKGLVPVLVADRVAAVDHLTALTALAAFLGHLYSCFLRFDGGKGMATAFGALLVLGPYALAVTVPAFLATTAFTRYVSLASLTAAALLPLALLAFGYPTTTVAVGLVMAILIAVRHRDNIRRLRFGTEARIGSRRTSADSGVA